MSRKRKHHRKSAAKTNRQAKWPSWFIELVHPAEREILSRVLRSNEHLSEIYIIVQMMQINYIVFKRNYEELERLQNEIHQPMIFEEIAFQTNRGGKIAQEAIIEFTRLLHNFLASAKMQVDVTRRWVRQQFADSEFLDIYQKEISRRFANDVQAQFLEDLRNFTLHRALPLAVLTLDFQKVSEHTLRSSVKIVLLKEYLREWKKWSELGRMQIEMAFGDGVDIMSICKQYFDNVTEFTQWLFWQVRDLFSDEIAQINSIVENVRNQ